jgi:hypothetical protein
MDTLKKGIDKEDSILIKKFPIKSLSLSKKAINQSMIDVRQGSRSFTKGSIEVMYNIENGQFIVTDGYHRIVDYLSKKQQFIPAKIWSTTYSDYHANIQKDDLFFEPIPMNSFPSFDDPNIIKEIVKEIISEAKPRDTSSKYFWMNPQGKIHRIMPQNHFIMGKYILKTMYGIPDGDSRLEQPYFELYKLGWITVGLVDLDEEGKHINVSGSIEQELTVAQLRSLRYFAIEEHALDITDTKTKQKIPLDESVFSIKKTYSPNARFGLGDIAANGAVDFKEFSRDTFGSQIHGRMGNPGGVNTFRYADGIIDWSNGHPSNELKQILNNYLEKKGFPIKNHTSYYDVFGKPDDDIDEHNVSIGETTNDEQRKAKEAYVKQYISMLNDDTVVITVNKDPSYPPSDYIQVDGFVNGKNLFSSNSEDLNMWGFRMPSTKELMILPRGQYKLSDAKKLLHKPLEESIKKLDERMSFADLYDDTDDDRIFKSKLPGMRVRPMAISMENGNETWNFGYTSQEKSEYDRYGGKIGHKGRIIFFKDSVEPDDNAEDLECMVDCDCRDFKFRFAYVDAQQDASMIGPNSLNKATSAPPIKTNPEGETKLCKHLAALVRYLVTNLDKARQRAHLRNKPFNIFEAMNEMANKGSDTTNYYEKNDSVNEGIINEDLYEYFYHFTTPEALPSIVIKGLIPSENTNWGGDLGNFSHGKVFVAKNFRQANYYGNIIWRNYPNRYRPILRFKYNKLRFIPDKETKEDMYVEYPIKAKFEIFVYNEHTKIDYGNHGDIFFKEKTGEWRPLTKDLADSIATGEWDGEEGEDITENWNYKPSDYPTINKKLEKIGYDINEESSDLPIDWDAVDLQIDRKWDEYSVRKFVGLPDTFIAIYPSIVDVNELDAHTGGDEETGIDDYEYDDFRHTKRGFPPIVIMRDETGVYIVDGNHRVYWSQKNDYQTIGAWVVDKLLQKDIESRNKQNIKETRIITPEESLYEGYITLYHGTTWPLALKAKKGELGPQDLEKLIVDILVNVYHETPMAAREIFEKYSSMRKKDPNFLFFTTNKKGAERYACSSTKYGGEIFYDVIGGYLWNKNKGEDLDKIKKHLFTDEPAIVTINVPLEMVLTHPNWNTPLRRRLRDIRKNILKNPELKDVLSDDLNIEVFVKENIPARFVQRIDRVYSK